MRSCSASAPPADEFTFTARPPRATCCCNGTASLASSWIAPLTAIAKAGSRTLGTEIRIVTEEESRAAKPDYYLVLPWHFKKEFLERERETIFAGTKMIFPLPEVEIVSKDNYETALRAAAEGSGSLQRLLLGEAPSGR